MNIANYMRMYVISQLISESYDEIPQYIEHDIVGPIIIRNMDESEKYINDALALVCEVFQDHIHPTALLEYLNDCVDIRKSIVAVDSNDSVVGVYYLGDLQLNEFLESDQFDGQVHVDISDYMNKRGVEGVAVCVDPQYHGNGVFKQMLNYVNSLGFDYVWGQHLKSLGNLDQWTTRRELIATASDLYVTATKLK